MLRRSIDQKIGRAGGDAQAVLNGVAQTLRQRDLFADRAAGQLAVKIGLIVQAELDDALVQVALRAKDAVEERGDGRRLRG